MTSRDKASFLKRFWELLKDANAADGGMAKLMNGAVGKHGEEAIRLLLKTDAELHASTINMLIRKGKAWGVLPFSELWLAIGYPLCAKLAESGMTEKQIKSAVRAILKRRNSGGVVPSAHEIVSKEIGKRVKVKVLRTEAEDDQGDPEEESDQETDFELLVREIKNLAEGQLPILRTLLSSRALKVLGLAQRKRRA